MNHTLALVGPTAVGKTTVSLAIAPAFDAEVVGVDSMTVYRGMDVGTAKPSAAERARVPHHLVDVRDPAEAFSVAGFQRAARAAIADIHGRGRTPLLVGGSGLYFRAVVDDLDFPPTDPAVRARLEREDHEALRARLRTLDPEAARFVDPANTRRVVRALEVIEITGRRFSEFRGAWQRYASRFRLVAAGLELAPALLSERIEQRVRAQVAAGLFDEVRALLARGYRDTLTASQAIPYREAIAHVDGALTVDEFVGEATRANRRLARRQMAWFRRDPRIRWFDAADTPRAAEAIRAYYEECLRAPAAGAGARATSKGR